RTGDFRNTVIIMTSNVGASELKRNKYVGFSLGDEQQDYKEMKDKVTEELKKAFRPEFLNRIDETIVFHSLEKKHMRYIVDLMVSQLQDRLKEQEITFTLTEKALNHISEEGFEPEYGARPLRRSIQKNVEDLLSEELLKENIQKGEQITIDIDNSGKFVIQ